MPMTDNSRQQRETEIYAAAYALLAQHGYGGTSMLRVAKAAKASNETLYRWYGDKDGLFTAMVRANAAETHALLAAALEENTEPWSALGAVAPVFLRMILGDQAVLLNRAAAADPGGALGAAISAGGRASIMPLMAQLVQRICAGSTVDAAEASEWFLAHLIGDLQVRRIIHDCNAPTGPEIAARSARALALLRRLILGENRVNDGRPRRQISSSPGQNGPADDGRGPKMA